MWGETQTFGYDNLNRLTSASATDGFANYDERYTYDDTTGNLLTKGTTTNVNNQLVGALKLSYDSNHDHAVAALVESQNENNVINTYGYDDNGNMTSRNVNGQNFTLNYDAENRLISVTGAAPANFYYDADGKQVKAVVDGVTTFYIGNHYEVKSGVVTKYYFAGTTRIAIRTNGTLSFLLADHLGSSSLTTDANGLQTAQALYKAFGETRYTLGDLGTDYHFTGQREEASLGIYFFNARWMDPSLGRFTSPDTIVPTGTQGTQAWDRYAFVNNNPVRYNDPTGHRCVAADGEDEDCLSGDGSRGAGFTGVASASSGVASKVVKGCGGVGQHNYQGGLDDLFPMDDKATKAPDLPTPEVNWGQFIAGVIVQLGGLFIQAVGLIVIALVFAEIAVGIVLAPETFTISAVLSTMEAPVAFGIGVGMLLIGSYFYRKGAEMEYESGVPAMIENKITSSLK
jgi:RHS repeat-associated protein